MLFSDFILLLLFLTLILLVQASKPATPAGPTDEDKRAERLAKLEAWKQKQAAERERKQREMAAAGPRNILEEIDRKSRVSPTVSNPQSPATPGTDATPATDATPPTPGRKFDPKVIAKSTQPTAAAPAVLGDDVAVPEAAKTSAVQASKPSTATSCKLILPSNCNVELMLTMFTKLLSKLRAMWVGSD